MKKIRIIGLGLVLCLVLSLGIVLVNGNAVSAFATDGGVVATNGLSIENATREIFGDQKIKSTEYLHNYDDSTDYIYIDFEEYGYAVFFKDTLEMLEYSPQGNLPYQNSTAKRYYGGPANYLYKENDMFRNVATGEVMTMSAIDAKSYSNDMRAFLSKKDQELRAQEAYFTTERNVDFSEKVETESGSIRKSSQIKSNAPDINTNNLIVPPGATGTYIPNSQYFILNPTHGDNFTGGSYGNGNSGTCGPVAAQLMLSYNNYYNDRRIIENRFLNGFNDASNSVTNPARNPNLCTDPASMTSWTLGSRSEDTGVNSYYSNVVTTIMPANTSGSSITQIRNGMRTLLGQRLANNGFTVNSDEKGWFFGWSPISSTNIKAEINAERPLIIGMSSNLGGADHVVVGYGYQDYTYPNNGGTYSGYVVHFGWQGDTNVWVNSSWCDSYITMQINHTHNYNITVGGPYMEMKCGGCGHRKSLGQADSTMVSGDFYGNGKGHIAMFVTSGNQLQLRVWESTGSSFAYSGVWWSTQASGYNIDMFKGRVVAGDFDGDGKADIAAFYDYGGDYTRIHVWLAKNISSNRYFEYQGDNGWWQAADFCASTLTGRVVCGDFNGDGRNDIAAIYDGGTLSRIYVWLSTGSGFNYQGGSGWWQATDFYASTLTGRVVFGDFNGDGRDDIAAIYDDGTFSRIYVWLSTGSSFNYQGGSGLWQTNNWI